jgi:hypothetical protein
MPTASANGFDRPDQDSTANTPTSINSQLETRPDRNTQNETSHPAQKEMNEEGWNAVMNHTFGKL